MATDKNFADFVASQIEEAGNIRYRKMFGEYAFYCNDKVVGLICDNQVFVKPTEAGRRFIGSDVKEAPAYEGAKNSFLIEDKIEDRDWFCELIRLTEQELPVPKKKKPKKK
ncbi:MAG: TfoX/Sxy family protein [Spirochaetales bacterium]|nr:TfoX/Sxy family protein [Spirochaetales bacterium]